MWGKGIGRGQAFDVGDASPTLLGELRRTKHASRPGMSALVPGCGRGYDSLALARHGFDRVVAVDLVEKACEAAREELQGCKDPAAERVTVQCADYFALEGQYDFIWDCTFLCALDPVVRERWAKKQVSLLKPGGTLVTCIFPICDKEGGPPYAMSVPLVRSLLEPQGLKAERIIEDLPAQEQHMAAKAGLQTAVAVWVAPEIATGRLLS